MARIVFIGDDFTGASDTLATLAERGARVRLFLDAPEADETAGLDAVGIATDLRARSPAQIDRRLRHLAPAIRALAPRIVHYKVCSTFDSAPHVGSIGTAARVLEEVFAARRTIVVGGQPSLGRYCVFGTLFARGPDGVVHRIDRHPIMSRHPVTPMNEADLRVHLGRQGLERLDLVSRDELRGDENALGERMSRPGRMLVDALDQSDIERLGGVLGTLDAGGTAILMIGASGVAEALCAAAPPHASTVSRPAAPGPRLAIAGSRSSATAAQVAAATSYEHLPLGRDDLAAPDKLARRCAVLLADGRNVLVHLRPDMDYGVAAVALSDRLARLARSILDLFRVPAIAIAGGDTSSAVVEKLGFRSLSFVERGGPGVAICLGHAHGPADGMLLLLKGGQVGDVETLERFAARGRA